MQINNNLILVIKKICKLRFMKKIFIIIIFTVSLFEPSLCKDLKNLKTIVYFHGNAGKLENRIYK